jgi:hypothetical protein
MLESTMAAVSAIVAGLKPIQSLVIINPIL